jgi:hypothetical protein
VPPGLGVEKRTVREREPEQKPWDHSTNTRDENVGSCSSCSSCSNCSSCLAREAATPITASFFLPRRDHTPTRRATNETRARRGASIASALIASERRVSPISIDGSFRLLGSPRTTSGKKLDERSTAVLLGGERIVGVGSAAGDFPCGSRSTAVPRRRSKCSALAAPFVALEDGTAERRGDMSIAPALVLGRHFETAWARRRTAARDSSFVRCPAVPPKARVRSHPEP